LVDNIELGHCFREHFVDGLRKLILKGELRLEGEWFRLQDPVGLEAWLEELVAIDWNVFIEGPPNGRSRPTHVLKYLARYMTGGPISDHRLISDEDGRVTFWARSKDKAKGNPSEPFPLRGSEFVRRWAMHILPKGYTRSRSYGGYHGTKRAAYLASCRQLLGITVEDCARNGEQLDYWEPSQPTCPHCDIPMLCIRQRRRPSWREVFERGIYADPTIYSPLHHIQLRVPTASPIDDYG
jgi:hypothetical protein